MHGRPPALSCTTAPELPSLLTTIGTQQNEITASGKAPPNNLEAAILHTFPLANSGEFALLLDQLRDKRGPTGLVGSAKSATIVAIKVFMKPI